MKPSNLFQSSLLLTSSILATAHPKASPPSLKDRATRLRNEHFANINTNTNTNNKKSKSLPKRDLKPSDPGVSYHWAGAVVPPPTGANITSVTATMTLPELTAPDDGHVRTGPSGEYFLYVWVGIDGLASVDPGNCNALWQTGFAGQIRNGKTTWWGWACFLWDDDDNAVFDTHILDASAGDTINMTVQALNSTDGLFWLDNLTTGNATSYSVTGGGLCGAQAEWIVEDPWNGNTEVIDYMLVWPDFGTMVFDHAAAYTDAGAVVTPADNGSTLYVVESYYDNNITQNNVSVTGSEVAVTWLESGPSTKLGVDSS